VDGAGQSRLTGGCFTTFATPSGWIFSQFCPGMQSFAVSSFSVAFMCQDYPVCQSVHSMYMMYIIVS
jgi:hypothetical protein